MTADRDQLYIDLAEAVIGVGRELKARGEAHGVIPLSVNEAVVMRYIDRHPGSAPSAVASATGLQRSNLSAILRSLEDKRMVERVVDADDCRSARLFGTDVAHANLAVLQRNWRDRLAAALGDDTDLADLAAAVRVLQAIDEGLFGLREPARA